ncbi:MAG: glutathione S-transferase family protein [Polyangiaceae bacterium]
MIPLLVTISFSHFCDKARWALDLAQIEYREAAHLPAFHLVPVKRAGGRRTTPTLVTDERVLTDSSDILAWVDHTRPDLGLYGRSDDERREILELEDLFDEKLGPHARRWAYHHLLPDRAFAMAMFDAQTMTPAYERALMKVLFPVVRLAMQRSMGIDARSAERSRGEVDRVFDEIGERLASGRRYLVGDAFTAADLTFAALATAALLSDDPESRLPALADVPAQPAAGIAAWREHPAGVFARRIMREHRRPSAAS